MRDEEIRGYGALAEPRPSPRRQDRREARHEMEVLAFPWVGERDLFVELDAKPGSSGGMTKPSSQRIGFLRIRPWKPSQRSMLSRMRKFGLHAASWTLAAPTTGPQ